MTAILIALTPVLAIILLGFALKRSGFIADQAWQGMERLTYFVLFPALLIDTLSGRRLAGTAWMDMLMVIVPALLIASAALLLWQTWRKQTDAAGFTSIFQGGVRFNTFISLSLALAYFGNEGLALSALAAGFMIILINLLCISVFAVWVPKAVRGRRPILREILLNPLILACLIGWTLSLGELQLPGFLLDTLEILGRAALPFGLLAVGAALRPSALRGHSGAIAVSSLVQFGLKPLSLYFLLDWVGLSGVAAGVLIIAFMVPTAPSGYILARQLGGDTETMASIITFQTILGFALMPLIAAFLITGVN